MPGCTVLKTDVESAFKESNSLISFSPNKNLKAFVCSCFNQVSNGFVCNYGPNSKIALLSLEYKTIRRD